MRNKMTMVAAALLAVIATASAQNVSPPAKSGGPASSMPVYGSQLMTQEERNAYRARMHSAKTAQEREAIRAEHHAEMAKRAQERGVTLPAEPPARRGGPGSMHGPGAPGGGMGRGMGSGMGGGMGSGPGNGTGPAP